MSVASPSRPVRRDAPSSTKPHILALEVPSAAGSPTAELPPVATSAAPAAAEVSPPVLEVPSPATTPAALPQQVERVSPRNDLAYSTGDAAAYSLMVGLGETYFSAFA